MSTNPATSDGSIQTLSALGPSQHVLITSESARASLPPGLFAVVSADANLQADVELSCATPDANGDIPPGSWFAYDGFPDHHGAFLGQASTQLGPGCSAVGKIAVVATAVRANVLAYSTGSVRFGVSQAHLPKPPGA